ncbi:MAG: hypothetical protein EA350_04440 [Gemmatimonadales bacterium]|nr:MAG: hypothetical protein EA350_04440 [Gemmatimonadales bacterium]
MVRCIPSAPQMLGCVVAAFLLAAPAPAPVSAQATIEAPIVERRLEDRWIPVHRPDSLVAFRTHRLSVHDPKVVQDTLAFRLQGLDGPLVVSVLGPTGAPLATRVVLPEVWPPYPFIRSLDADAESQGHRLLAAQGMDGVVPAEAHARDLVVRPPLPGAGRWADTVRGEGSAGPWKAMWEEVRSFRVVGDTAVNGTSLRVVEVSSRVRIEDEQPWSRFAGPPGVRLRVVEGVGTGRILMPPAGGLVFARNDTLHLHGVETVDMEGGGRWSTPVAYEGHRAERYFTPGEWAAEWDARMQPSGEDEQAEGGSDPHLLEEALRTWRSSTDLAERNRSGSLLRSAPDSLRPTERGFLEGELMVGDTAAAIGRMVGWITYRPRPALTREDLEFLLPFLSDPARALAVGVNPFREAHALARASMLMATAALAREGGLPAEDRADQAEHARFTEDAWRMLLNLDREARIRGLDPDPLVDGLALAARAAEDPRRGGDELLAVLAGEPTRTGTRIAPDHFTFGQMADMARGIGFTAGASARATLPDPGASWEAWSVWMAGRSDAHQAWLASTQLPSRNDPPPAVGFSQVHHVTLQFHERRTGRDFPSEWRAGIDGGIPADSARLVFGHLLREYAGAVPSPDEVARALAHPNPVVRQHARGNLHALFRSLPMPPPRDRDGVPASMSGMSGEEADVVSHLLEALLEPAFPDEERAAWPWPHLNPEDLGSRSTLTGPPVGPSSRTYLESDRVPAALVQPWLDAAEGGIALTTPEAWGALDPRESRIILIPYRPDRIGPFLRIGFDWVQHLAGEPHASPVHHEGGSTFYLLQTPEGWKIAASSWWIS